jgi:hypothetical protein
MNAMGDTEPAEPNRRPATGINIEMERVGGGKWMGSGFCSHCKERMHVGPLSEAEVHVRVEAWKQTHEQRHGVSG